MILSESVLQRVLDQALCQGADFAEVFVENTYQSHLALKDSQVSEGIVGRLNGMGLRIIYGTEEIYTHSNDLSEKNLLKVAKMAAQAMKGSANHKAAALSLSAYDSIHKFGLMPWEMNKDIKVSNLFRFDKAARARHSTVSQVIGTLKEVVQQVQIANSEGLLKAETRHYTNVGVQVMVEDQGLKEMGTEREGAMASSDFLEQLNLEKLAETATDRAVQNLSAEFAPAGQLPVVLDNGFGGVIFHEACGHGLETTAVANDASVFCGLLGEKIADDCVTAIDDGTIPQSYGSLMIDDEGMMTQKTVLIENGVLKSYLVDRLGGIKTGYQRTGSGRRENYRFPPTSRMRNTFIAAGDASLEELIGDVDNGIYAKRMGGGSVTPGTGAYNFAVSEAFLIKNGRIDKPIKGASLIGTGIETLKRIKKVGKDCQLAAGTCGSVSGWLPVTVGQPALLVSQLTVGGRS